MWAGRKEGRKEALVGGASNGSRGHGGDSADPPRDDTARIDMERRAYPLHVIHEYRMDKDAVQKTAAFLRKSDPEKLRIKCGISGARMALLPYAIEVLYALVESFAPIDIALSSYGIREGLLYEQMSKKLQNICQSMLRY